MLKMWVCSQGKFLIQDWVYQIENNFTQNKYNKLQKISAKNKWFLAKNKCKSANMGYTVSVETFNIHLQGLDIIDTYTNSIVKIYFYLI